MELNRIDAPNISFMEEIPCKLSRCKTITSDHGTPRIIGSVDGLTIDVTEYYLRVTRGSICKWHKGDNYRGLSLVELHDAVKNLSECLGVDMFKASITRVDFATVVTLNSPVRDYLTGFGSLKHTKRLEMDVEGLTYKGKKNTVEAGCDLCMYDKNAETKQSKGGVVPDKYKGLNVLRFERRFIGRKGVRRLRLKHGTIGDLFGNGQYTDILNEIIETFSNINKDRDMIMGQSPIKGAKDINMLGRVSLVKCAGGIDKLFTMLDAKCKNGEIDKVTLSREKKRIRDAVSSHSFMVDRETAVELSKKVEAAINEYKQL